MNTQPTASSITNSLAFQEILRTWWTIFQAGPLLWIFLPFILPLVGILQYNYVPDNPWIMFILFSLWLSLCFMYVARLSHLILSGKAQRLTLRLILDCFKGNQLLVVILRTIAITAIYIVASLLTTTFALTITYSFEIAHVELQTQLISSTGSTIAIPRQLIEYYLIFFRIVVYLTIAAYVLYLMARFYLTVPEISVNETTVIDGLRRSWHATKRAPRSMFVFYFIYVLIVAYAMIRSGLLFPGDDSMLLVFFSGALYCFSTVSIYILFSIYFSILATASPGASE